jgi:hypothetical protein
VTGVATVVGDPVVRFGSVNDKDACVGEAGCASTFFLTVGGDGAVSVGLVRAALPRLFATLGVGTVVSARIHSVMQFILGSGIQRVVLVLVWYDDSRDKRILMIVRVLTIRRRQKKSGRRSRTDRLH